MRLDSFNAGYSIAEDRILLQATGDGQPQNYWITRRAALMLGEGIQNVLLEQCAKFGAQTISSAYVGEVLSFERESAVSKHPPKPGKLLEDNAEYAVLLFQISYSAENADYCTIQLTDQNQQGYRYQLSSEMLHALLNLIQSQCDQAGWGIQLNKPPSLSSRHAAVQALH